MSHIKGLAVINILGQDDPEGGLPEYDSLLMVGNASTLLVSIYGAMIQSKEFAGLVLEAVDGYLNRGGDLPGKIEGRIELLIGV